MPQVYLKKEYYDELVKRGYNVTETVNMIVEKFLKEERRE
jgi:ribosomal protein S16